MLTLQNSKIKIKMKIVHKGIANLSLLFFIVLMIVLSFSSCSGPKKINEQAPEPDYFVAPDLRSTININYKIKKQSLTDTFNFVMDEMMKEELKFDDYNATVKLKRNGNVLVEFQGKSALVTIPIQVNLLKKTFIKDFKANGNLEMTFISNFDISKEWKLSTSTLMTDHKWTKKPTIDLGIIDLPIETLANFVIRKTRGEMEKNIDASMASEYNLPLIIKEVAKYTLTPFELDSIYGGWFQMVADSAFLTPAGNTKSYIEGKISLKTQVNLSSSRPKEETFKAKVPPFAWKEKVRDSSLIQLIMELDYEHMTRVARKNFTGTKFSEGSKSIEVLDVVVGKSKGKLQLSVTVKGSFNGQLILEGIPSFDKNKSLLYGSNVEVSVKTGNVLHKAASWLLKGKIKSELDKMLQFNITDNLDKVQEQVNQNVIAMNKKYKMDLKAVIGSIVVDNIALRPDRVNAFISVKLWLGTTLDTLYLFQN